MNWTKPIDLEELDLDRATVFDEEGILEITCICGAVYDGDTLDDPPAICTCCGAALGRDTL